jgi:prophage regulatory protein
MVCKPKRARSRFSDVNGGRATAHTGPARPLSGLPRTIRRHELRLIVPLADSTIFEMEKRGEFPHRFNLSPRCVVWDLAEVEAWLDDRRKAYFEGRAKVAPAPDLSRRRSRPLKSTPE